MHYNEETFDRITIVYICTDVPFGLKQRKLTLFGFLLVYHIYSIL
jgi:hypothetical protein